MKERLALAHSPSAIRLVLVILLILPLTPSAWAVLLTGFIEGTAVNGWKGSFAVQLTDGSVVTGVDQMTSFLNSFSTLPLTTTGGTNCTTVTDLTTATQLTMSSTVLDLVGSSTLGGLGSVSWEAQPFWVLPGDPAPTAAVLAITSGTLGGTMLTPSTFSFGFNGTLTAAFNSVMG